MLLEKLSNEICEEERPASPVWQQQRSRTNKPGSRPDNSEILIIGDSNLREMKSEKFSGQLKTHIVSNCYTCEDAKRELDRNRDKKPKAIMLHI